METSRAVASFHADQWHPLMISSPLSSDEAFQVGEERLGGHFGLKKRARMAAEAADKSYPTLLHLTAGPGYSNRVAP